MRICARALSRLRLFVKAKPALPRFPFPLDSTGPGQSPTSSSRFQVADPRYLKGPPFIASNQALVDGVLFPFSFLSPSKARSSCARKQGLSGPVHRRKERAEGGSTARMKHTFLRPKLVQRPLLLSDPRSQADRLYTATVTLRFHFG